MELCVVVMVPMQLVVQEIHLLVVLQDALETYQLTVELQQLEQITIPLVKK